MKRLKTIVKWILLAIMAVIIAVFAYIYINKDEIIEDVRIEMNKSISADIDFKNPDLTLFSSFPNIGLRLENLAINSKKDVKHQQLLIADEATIVIDLASVINKSEPEKIIKFSIVNPIINIHDYKNGITNYSFDSKGTIGDSSKVKKKITIDINRISIKNGIIQYSDHNSGYYTKLSSFNLDGKGSVKGEMVHFDTKLSTMIDKMNTGSMTVFNNTNASFDGNIIADTKNSKYTINNSVIKLNDLAINTNGDIHLNGDDIDINAKMRSKNDSFKQLLSLIPSLYTKDFNKVQTKGTADLNIDIAGTYGKRSFPHMIINSTIHDASVHYPEKAETLNDIQMKINMDIISTKKYTIDIPSFHFLNKNQPFDGKLLYTNKNKSSDIDLVAKGIIDLGLLHKSIELKDVEHMNGIINSDIKLKAKLSDIMDKNYEKIDFSGFLNTDKISIKTKNSPEIKLSNTNVNMNPKLIDIPNIRIQSANDIINGKIKLKNPLAMLTNDQPIELIADVEANQINVDQWISKSKDEKINENPSLEEDISKTTNFTYDIKAKANKIIYEGKTYTNNSFIGKGNQSQVSISKANTTMNKNSIAINGELRDFMEFAKNTNTLKGKLNISAPYINLNEFMNTGATSQSNNDNNSSTTPQIPELIDVIVYGDIKKLLYDDIVLNKLKGNIILKDRVMKFDNLNCLAFDGEMNFNGFYDTKTAERPKFDINYNNKKLSFVKAFQHVDILKKLMPIMQYIDGLMSTKLSFAGSLDKNLEIDPSSITADGYFETVNATLSKFGVSNKLSDLLGVKELKRMKINDSKNWFTIKDGTIEIKEFDQHIKGIDLKISGSQNLTQEIDYLVKAHIPREMLKKSAISNTVNTGIDLIQSEASKLGVNINAGSHIDLDIKVSGTITNPKFKIIPTGTSGKSVSEVVVDAVKDEVKKRAKEVQDSVQRVADKLARKAKDSINRKAQEIKDALNKKVQEEKDRAIQIAKEKARKELEKRLEKANAKRIADSLEQILKEKAKDVIPDGTQDELDKLKDKLKNWDPFKKK